MINEVGRGESADQIARDIAGHIGGEDAGGGARREAFAEIPERQRESRSHEQSLHDAQGGEDFEIGREGEQRRRRGKQRENADHARAAVDAAGEKGDGQTRHSHAERRRIDREARPRGGRPVMNRQRWQDRLGGEEIDQRQKRENGDHQGAERRAPGHHGRVERGLVGEHGSSLPEPS